MWLCENIFINILILLDLFIEILDNDIHEFGQHNSFGIHWKESVHKVRMYDGLLEQPKLLKSWMILPKFELLVNHQTKTNKALFVHMLLLHAYTLFAFIEE